MKIKTVSWMVVLVLVLIIGVVLFYVDGVTSKAEGLKPIYVFFIGIGTSLITLRIKRKFFTKEKDKDKDERNSSIESKAKAEAFDTIGIVFGVLMIIYVAIKVNLLTILLMAVAYLFIYAVYMVYFTKYHKEM